MQFAVPQFTEVEDRLIGSLTLKQFLVLLAAGGLCLLFWTVLGPSIIFFILSLPVAILGVASAMGRYNGRPLFTYLVPFAAFVSSNRVMVFKREEATISVSKSKLAQAKKIQDEVQPVEPAESRLKKLAYTLDRKTEEEKEIISNDDREIIRATTLPKIELTKVFNKAKADIIATAKKLDKTVTRSTADIPVPAKVPPKRKVVKLERFELPETPKPQPKKRVEKKFDPSSFLQ